MTNDYAKHLDDHTLCIKVDMELYYAHKDFFNCILHSFSPYNAADRRDATHLIYITSNPLQAFASGYRIFCNPDNPQWKFQLICELEEVYATLLNCTVLHGACLEYNGKGILILGSRRSGKTTLVYNLIRYYNAKYLDDDCVYCINGKYYGFLHPVSLRYEPDSHENRTLEIQDSDNCSRWLVSTENRLDILSQIDVVLFPQYGVHLQKQMRLIGGSELFERVINNTRHSKDMISLFRDVCSVIQNAKSYIMEYASSYEALELVNQACDFHLG